MNFIKGILQVRYIKNKGLRRICFLVGLFLCLCCIYLNISNIFRHKIDITFEDLQELNDVMYFEHSIDHPAWYIKAQCLNIKLKEYGLNDNYTAYAFTTYKKVLDSQWCEYYTKECNILKSIKDKPFRLKCNGIEDETGGVAKNIFIAFCVWLLAFYFPFIILCLLKISFLFTKKIVLWIYKGFKEEIE